ncbi:MAG: DNA polymerase IV [Candidatus Omnitrophota bacterium]|jgi:nucleotidyltransferase/DNA polymerase involved in DNA repair
MGKRRYIAHVDMDAFFAAIEQRDDPRYRAKPVIIGADPRGGKGRGVVSTCSYEARSFGVHSAMPIGEAYRICPQGIFLPVNMEKYEAVSRRIYEIFYSFTPDIDPVGIDEAFLDMTGSFHLFGTALQACLSIKKRIREDTGLTASCGLAPTMMAAKIASDLKKPDGMVEVQEDALLEFLHPLDVRRLWGLGPKSEAVLNGMGIKTIGDLAGRDVERLESVLGKNGRHLWELANGIDERKIEGPSEAKSISNETTFERDTSDRTIIERELISLCEKVSGRMRSGKLKARTITLKIRLEGFHTYTRSSTILSPTNFTEVIYKEISALYDKFDRKGKRVRLIGVRATGFSGSEIKDSLFGDPADEKREKVHGAIDLIREKFGEGVIYRAGGMQ